MYTREEFHQLRLWYQHILTYTHSDFLRNKIQYGRKIWRDAEVMWGDIFFSELGGLGSRVRLSVQEDSTFLGSDCAESSKGQLDQKTNKFFVRISALASKKRLNQKKVTTFFVFFNYLKII